MVESDAASLPDIGALAERVRSEFGRFEVLFANAGFTHLVPFDAVTEAVYDELMDINAKGPYFLVQLLTPLMPDGGAVVLTTSVSNVKGQAG